MVRAFVGSGGKTTLLRKQAQLFREEGKRVFVTTSTHMFIEDDTLLTDDADAIIRQLRETGYVMAGLLEGKKIRPLSPATYARVCAQADVVLVEADGSNRRPVKFPRETEPVIYDNVEQIVVVCGLQALGKPLAEAAHRPELVMQCLGVPEDTAITLEHIARLVFRGYLCPLGRKYPNAALSVYPAGGTGEDARRLFALLRKEQAENRETAEDSCGIPVGSPVNFTAFKLYEIDL